jgi:hypothetical protein
MAITDKQARNGLPELPAAANPQPGPMPDLAALQSQAESAANERKGATQALIMSPQGSGTAGHSIGAAASSFEWDDGLAVSEQPGEA